MNKKILYLTGAVFVLLLGTFLHFTYNLSEQNALVGFISAKDESTLQHLKLLFFPYIIFSAAEFYKCGIPIKKYLFVKILSVFFGMAVIVLIFYSYTFVIGKNFLTADILTFISGDAAAFLLSYLLLYSQE